MYEGVLLVEEKQEKKEYDTVDEGREMIREGVNT